MRDAWKGASGRLQPFRASWQPADRLSSAPPDNAGDARMHVGVAGLGKMGAAIAHRLIETGNEVTVWNRSAEKCRPLAAAGAAVAASAAGLAGAAETIITTLTDAAAIESVYGGPSGLLAGDVEGKLFIEMSTV